MRITAGDDVAFVTALMRCAGTEVSGQDIELDFRLTIGLRKRTENLHFCICILHFAFCIQVAGFFSNLLG
jgi:ketosteroid isomerase-like protein